MDVALCILPVRHPAQGNQAYRDIGLLEFDGLIFWRYCLRTQLPAALHWGSMETLLPLASTLGLGMLAGARLYATVFAVGLLLRFNWVTLPAAWQHASVLADTRVLIVAGIACAVEFVADKIPWVDSAWDSIHTFIRPIGAALMASSLFSNVQPAYQVVLFLLAGGMALSGHSAKAATRLTVNHSPEPFTNLALSVGEDAFVAGGLYMVVKHPWAMAGIALLFLGLFAWLAPRTFRVLRAEWAAIRARLRHWTGQGDGTTHLRAGAVAGGSLRRPITAALCSHCHCGREGTSQHARDPLPDRA